MFTHMCREERKNEESSILVYSFVTFILHCVFSVLRISKSFVLAWNFQNQRLFYPSQLMNPSFWEWHTNSCPPTIWFSLSKWSFCLCFKNKVENPGMNAGLYSQLKIQVWHRPKEMKRICKSFNHYLPSLFQVTGESELSLRPFTIFDLYEQGFAFNGVLNK